MTTEATTEPSRHWWRRSVPVRLRITVAVVVLAAMALVLSGVTVYVLQKQRVDQSVDQSLSRELARFEKVTTDQTVNSTAASLLRAAVARAVPTPSETVVAFVNGAPRFKPATDDHDALIADPEFVRAVEGLTQRGGGVDEFSTAEGPQQVAVRVVSDATDTGAIVFSYSMDEAHAELSDTMRMYSIVAAISLGVVAVGAYVVSGRLLRPIRDLRETADEISDSDLSRRIPATGNDDITALTRHLQPDARPARRGVLGPAAVPRRRRPRAQDPAHRSLRGHLELLDVGQPSTRSPRPASCCSTRSTGCRGWSAS